MKFDICEAAEVGMNGEILDEAQNLLIQGIRHEEYTGAVYMIGRHGKISARGVLGRLGPEYASPVSLDSIFDLASVTKPVATAASLMALVDHGALQLDQAASQFFPERVLPQLTGITLRHLATHTSGLPAWIDMYSQGQSRDEAIEQLLGTKLQHPRGTVYSYSCLGYIILGLIIERVSGKTLADFAADNIFRPLGMNDTCYNPSIDVINRIVHTADCPMSRRKSIAEVQDGNALAMGGYSGNAGLFSTAPDLAVFAQAMLNGGEFNGVRILSAESVREMFTSQIDPSLGRQSIGFFMPPHGMLPCEDGWSKACAGHTGYSGTCLVIDRSGEPFRPPGAWHVRQRR